MILKGSNVNSHGYVPFFNLKLLIFISSGRVNPSLRLLLSNIRFDRW
jgi:hypothetical protein